MKNRSLKFYIFCTVFITTLLTLNLSCKNRSQDNGGGAKTFKVTLQNVEHGTIECQKDGKAFTELDKVPKDTKLHFVLKADQTYVPTLLSIGETNYGELSADGTIEADAIITKNIVIKGVCSNSFVKIDVKTVEHGAITAKKEDGSSFTTFSKVKLGTKLTFILESDDGYIPEKLTIDGKDNTTFTQHGTIEETLVINKEMEVSGLCKVRSGHFVITVTQPEHGEIICEDEDGKPFTDFNNVEDGKELIFALISKDDAYIPKYLQIGSTKNDIINAQNAIVESITVRSNLDVRGELVEKFLKINVKDVEHGKITCKEENGDDIEDFSSIEYGSHLIFKLKADKGYEAEKLIIDGKEYTEPNTEGSIEQKVKVDKAFEVSGSCIKSTGIFKITLVVEPSDKGEILCKKEDGNLFTDLDSCSEGTKLIFVLKAKDENSQPQKLTVGENEYTKLNAKGEIESALVEVKSNLTIRGVIEDKPNYFKINVMKVENGVIRCKNEDGSQFTSFDKVKEGTKLIFTLSPNDGYVAKSLTVANKTYDEPTVDGFIISDVMVVQTSFEVSGVCKDKNILGTFKVKVLPVENGTITCKKEGEDTSFTDFDHVVEGTVLIFTLSANDKTTHKPSCLTLGKEKYTNLNGEGNIVGRLEILEDGIEVKGECIAKEADKKWKIKITQPEVGGTITCTKDDGTALDLNAVPDSTKIKVTLQAETGYHAKTLEIAKELVEATTDKTKIEKEWLVQQNLQIKGECVPFYVVNLKDVPNGKITCIGSTGNALTAMELLEVEEGESLIFELRTLDPAQYEPNNLKVNDTTYTEVIDGAITSSKTIVEGAITAEGSVTKTGIALKKVILENDFLEVDAMTKDEKAIKETGVEHILNFPAVPTYIESLQVLLEVSPSGAKVQYTPPLQGDKWVLQNGENTLNIEIGDTDKLRYTLKITRVDIEIKEISLLQYNVKTDKSKRIKFTEGDYKTNNHFTMVEDIDGTKYLTFALKEGAYDCQDDEQDPPTPLYLYKATLKTDPPKEISGHFFVAVKHPTTGNWDDKPPINVESSNYNDADPIFDDTWHPNMILDDAGGGMWIPAHIFGADFEILNNVVDLYEINFMVQNVSGSIGEDLDEKNLGLNLFKFAEHDDATYPLKKFNNLKISNTAPKILVHVLLEQAGAKVTSIAWKGGNNVKPSGDGVSGFYRYIEFTNQNIDTQTLVIKYESANGKKKKVKNAKIFRVKDAYNATVSSIKVCGVKAVLVDGNYEVLIPKSATHVGKVEVVFEDKACKYTVKTYEQEEDGSWVIGSDITKKDNVDFSKKENQELGIDANPPIGFLYHRFYSVTVRVEE